MVNFTEGDIVKVNWDVANTLPAHQKETLPKCQDGTYKIKHVRMHQSHQEILLEGKDFYLPAICFEKVK